MGLISGCRYLKVNLKAKMFICVHSSIQRCPNKIIKIFLIEDFSHLPPVSTTPVVNLELWISSRIFEKIRNGPNGILWGWGETDWRKKPEAKNLVTLSLYKDSVTRFFASGFFHELVSPPPQSIPFRPFRIFVENSRRYSRVKVHHRYQWHRWQLPPVSTTRAAKLPLVSTTPVANLPPVSATPAANFYTIFASVVDTGGK